MAKKKTTSICKRLFGPIRLIWWQTALLKLSVLLVGAMLGAYFPEFFMQIEILAWAVAGASVAVLWFLLFRGRLVAK